MYPMQEFSAYVFDPSLGHDVINVIRKFLMPTQKFEVRGGKAHKREVCVGSHKTHPPARSTGGVFSGLS